VTFIRAGLLSRESHRQRIKIRGAGRRFIGYSKLTRHVNPRLSKIRREASRYAVSTFYRTTSETGFLPRISAGGRHIDGGNKKN